MRLLPFKHLLAVLGCGKTFVSVAAATSQTSVGSAAPTSAAPVRTASVQVQARTALWNLEDHTWWMGVSKHSLNFEVVTRLWLAQYSDATNWDDNTPTGTQDVRLGWLVDVPCSCFSVK
jgi:hypothetical protein